MTRVLITGASGFVGGHVLRRVLDHTDWHVVCPRRPDTCWTHPISDRVESVPLDMSGVGSVWAVNVLGPVDVVMNLASDTDIPGSLEMPGKSVADNVRLMDTVLGYARHAKPRVLLHMSTNEVYGATGGAPHREWDPIHPDNPYAAGKAAQEAMAHAWWRSYGVPVVITNTMNPFGPGQPAGKFVATCIDRIVNGGIVSIQTDTAGVAASRPYIHVADLADAWIFLARHYLIEPPPLFPDAAMPDRFNIVGSRTIDNVSLFLAIRDAVHSVVGPDTARTLPVSDHLPTGRTPYRPGRDVHHSLDGSRLAALGWKASLPLGEALVDTVIRHPAMRRYA